MRIVSKSQAKRHVAMNIGMHVARLPVNQCWVVRFGDTIIDLDGQRLFNDLDDLKQVLRLKGLKVVRRKVVLA
jgi:hypothetical protein